MSTNHSAQQESIQSTDGNTVTSVEECAAAVIHTVQQLREREDIPRSKKVALYITDAPLVHSMISEYRDAVIEKANLVDIVQENIKAGNPIPESLPQTECKMGGEMITIAIQ